MNQYFICDTLVNLLLYSEQFGNSSGWNPGGTPVINDDTDIAPDGTLSADTITDNSTTITQNVSRTSSSFSINSYYTFSVHVKKDSTGRDTRFPYIRLTVLGSTSEGVNLRFDTKTGESSLTADNSELANGGVIDADPEYWRAWVSLKTDDSSNSNIRGIIYPAGGASSSWTQANSATGSIVAWGAQLHPGESPIPYLKTEASAVSGTAVCVQVRPEYNWKDSGEKVETRHRTRDGSEFVYKWGDFDKVSFGVSYVNSSFKSTVNSWWGDNTDLVFTENVDVRSVHLTNRTKPIDKLIEPYDDLFRGKIELGTY